MNDLSRQFGGNFSVNTAEFTRERQSDMINNYFNPTGKTLYNTLAESQQPSQNDSDTLRQEIAQLREIVARTQSQQNVPQQQQPSGMNTAPNVQQTNEVQQSNPTNETSSTSNVDDLLQELFGGKQETPQQPSQQTQNEQPLKQETPEQTVRTLIETSRITNVARDMGHNPDEVSKFIGSLTERDLVELYDAYKKQAQGNQQQQSLNQQGNQQYNSPPTNVSEMPRGNNVVSNQFPMPAQRHPIFG